MMLITDYVYSFSFQSSFQPNECITICLRARRITVYLGPHTLQLHRVEGIQLHRVDSVEGRCPPLLPGAGWWHIDPIGHAVHNRTSPWQSRSLRRGKHRDGSSRGPWRVIAPAARPGSRLYGYCGVARLGVNIQILRQTGVCWLWSPDRSFFYF